MKEIIEEVFSALGKTIGWLIAIAILVLGMGLSIHNSSGLGIIFTLGLSLFLMYALLPEKSLSSYINKTEELKSSAVERRLNEISQDASIGILASNTPGGKSFYISDQDRACVIGPPGTGKTSFLVNQIRHWIPSGRSFVCLDIKPEIYDITAYSNELWTPNPTYVDTCAF